MRTLAYLLTLLASPVASAQTVTTVVSNGTTQTRYDMVILGDGYQASEQWKFDQDVTTFLTALFQRQPYQTFAAYYNVHTVFRASVDSGADRPDETPPVFKNTVYNATYNFGGTDRCLYIQNTSQALADAALAPATEGRVLVMVNDSRYGGCAAQFAVSYNGSSMTEVQIHELGHSLGQLADEYDYPFQTYTGGEPAAVNITTSSTGAKWSPWLGTDGIAAFEGAGYYLYGLYRPRANCLMRSLGNILCRVCQEGITKITNSIVDTIVSTTPAAAAVQVNLPLPQPFSITHIVPAGNSPLITWRLDGAVVPGATGTSWTLNPTTVALGNHTVEVSVLDQSPLVRTDPAGVMRETHTWQVAVVDPNAAQLRLTGTSVNPVFVPAGSNTTVLATLHNDGPGAASNFAVEYFLSPTSSWSVQNIYLGKRTITSLGAGQSVPLAHPTQLPWSVPATVHYVHAVVDRVNVVPESNENDNRGFTACIVQNPTCGTWLEYRDPLVYSPNGATVSLGQGGTLRPTVVARCANPATTIYLIAWGGSGTAPGVPLGPGLQLPLNPDVLTDFGLLGLNGPVFGGFVGVLDGAGLGQATFTLPPAIALAPGQTHFAAVLLGSTQLFTAVSNPLALLLQP
jgi:hypothetical protein